MLSFGDRRSLLFSPEKPLSDKRVKLEGGRLCKQLFLIIFFVWKCPRPHSVFQFQWCVFYDPTAESVRCALERDHRSIVNQWPQYQVLLFSFFFKCILVFQRTYAHICFPFRTPAACCCGACYCALTFRKLLHMWMRLLPSGVQRLTEFSFIREAVNMQMPQTAINPYAYKDMLLLIAKGHPLPQYVHCGWSYILLYLFVL